MLCLRFWIESSLQDHVLRYRKYKFILAVKKLIFKTDYSFTLKFLKHTDVLTYRCNVSVTGRTDANSLENGTYSRLNLERNDRDAITKTRLEDCYKIYSFLNFCTRHMLHEEHYIKLQKNIDNEIIEIMPDMKQAFTRKAYDHHCDVNGCGTVLIFDADQKLTRKKCASKVGCKVMTVGDSNFKLEAKTGCIESPMQTSKLCKLCYEVYAEKTDCQELFLVDNIVDSKVDKKSKQKMYLVKWQGYSSNDNTWEPADNIPSILIEHYLKFGRCNISGDILCRKVINGTRMVEVKWNLDKSYDCTDNTWISCNSIDLIDESEVDETVKCNTSKTKKDFMQGLQEYWLAVTGHVAQNIDYFSEINCLVYDDACHLKKFINKRFPEQRISALTMKCDRVHFKNHTDDWCKENCNPNTEKLLENVNTEKMEQLFSWLSSYSYMVRYMKQSTYSFFILDMLDKHNFVIDGVDPF
ncbi:unnamed protein product [Mytilus edulis]|uniref:Chromo domain-containing protein n=1 Tax=Mytilus edulis TaxID=6550 RepID=A0A8S3TUK1_MYTED|nr:unnamed protein product [Mytilus edulis]